AAGGMMAAGLEGDAASTVPGGRAPASAMRLAMQTEAQVAETQAAAAEAAIPLPEFQPRSMLHVAGTPIERPRFPVIDFHAHLSWSARDRDNGEGVRFAGDPADLLPVMDRRGIRTMVNLTGGVGRGLQQTIARFDTAHPGRFVSFTEPWWGRASEPEY